jgi:hypothetical protein
MAANVTREEFEARVGVLEREVEGEKIVTRHILEQTRKNGDDLAAVKSRLDRIEQKLDGVDLKGLVTKVDGLDRKVDNLVRDLPKIVGDAVRDAFDKTPRKPKR